MRLLMNKIKQTLILAIIAAAAAGGLIAINSYGGSSVQAGQGGRAGAQKWEYCAITTFIFRAATSASEASQPFATSMPVGGKKRQLSLYRISERKLNITSSKMGRCPK